MFPRSSVGLPSLRSSRRQIPGFGSKDRSSGVLYAYFETLTINITSNNNCARTVGYRRASASLASSQGCVMVYDIGPLVLHDGQDTVLLVN